MYGYLRCTQNQTMNIQIVHCSTSVSKLDEHFVRRRQTVSQSTRQYFTTVVDGHKAEGCVSPTRVAFAGANRG